MKKLLIILAALLVASSLVACNNNDSKDNENNTDGTGINLPANTSGNDEQTTEKEVSNTPATDRTFKETNDKIVIASGSGALNLRTDTNLKDSSLSGKSLSTGTVIDRISTDGEWSKVTYEEKTYYVVNSYIGELSLFNGFKSLSETITITIKSSITIRTVPSSGAGNGTIIYQASKGEKVEVIGFNSNIGQKGWVKVKYTSDKGDTFDGYMSAHSDYSNFLELYSPVEDNTSSVEDTTSAEG